jgi:hypothetical protein
MRRCIDIVTMLCGRVKIAAEQALEGHSALHRHISIRWNWKGTGSYTLLAWRYLEGTRMSQL